MARSHGLIFMTIFNLQLIKRKLLSDPYYRMQSAQEIAIASQLGIKIDVNQASVDDWLRLPGISIHQARSLVELSLSGVPFYSIEDIAAALGMPAQRLKPLEPVLKFCYYDESEIIQQINPNTATIEQLAQLPHVDVSIAQAIVQNRLLDGSYRNIVDFQKRLSIPGQITAKLMHYLRF